VEKAEKESQPGSSGLLLCGRARPGTESPRAAWQAVCPAGEGIPSESAGERASLHPVEKAEKESQPGSSGLLLHAGEALAGDAGRRKHFSVENYKTKNM